MGISYSPRVSTSGVIFSLDSANMKSYSLNVFPQPLDSHTWFGPGGGYQMTLSRDSSVTDSPVGGVPLKIVTSGSSAYTGTYNSSTWNLAPAAIGQTWTFSFWVKGATSHTASLMIFEANSSGNYTALGQTFYSVTTGWTRVSGSYTMTQGTTAFVQVRIDNYNTGVTMWVDGLQLERGSAATNFSPFYNQNGNAWNDLTLRGNDGTLTNGPSYNSSNRGSILFDGIDDRIVITSREFNFSSGGTLESWIKLNAINRNQGFFGFNSSSYVNFWMPGSTNQMRWEVIGTTASSYSVIYSTTVFTTGVWYHVVGTFDGANMTIYVNGSQEATQVMTNQPTTYTATTYIGDYNAGGYPSSSNISSVRLYNRPLSAAEIRQNYQALRGRYGL
jgi:hypothetical protein